MDRARSVRDGSKIIAALYNDRSLLPDDEDPQPFETRYRNRTRRVHTLFGEIELRRYYHYHAKPGTGRCPLDDFLGLEGSHTPAVARLMCRAASRTGFYQEASDDLAAYSARKPAAAVWTGPNESSISATAPHGFGKTSASTSPKPLRSSTSSTPANLSANSPPPFTTTIRPKRRCAAAAGATK